MQFVLNHWLALLFLAYVMWRALDPFVIVNNGDKYLIRYTVARIVPLFRVFLHNIRRPDLDRNLHNHPWPNVRCLILWGGYTEVRLRHGHLSHRSYGPGDVNVLQSDLYHRIASVKPNTWTLVFAGKRSRSWGFLVGDEHIDWKEYLDVPDAKELND